MKYENMLPENWYIYQPIIRKGHEAYLRLGINEYDVIVWMTEEKEYEEFLEAYKMYLN